MRWCGLRLLFMINAKLIITISALSFCVTHCILWYEIFQTIYSKLKLQAFCIYTFFVSHLFRPKKGELVFRILVLKTAEPHPWFYKMHTDCQRLNVPGNTIHTFVWDDSGTQIAWWHHHVHTPLRNKKSENSGNVWLFDITRSGDQLSPPIQRFPEVTFIRFRLTSNRPEVDLNSCSIGLLHTHHPLENCRCCHPSSGIA